MRQFCLFQEVLQFNFLFLPRIFEGVLYLINSCIMIEESNWYFYNRIDLFLKSLFRFVSYLDSTYCQNRGNFPILNKLFWIRQKVFQHFFQAPRVSGIIYLLYCNESFGKSLSWIQLCYVICVVQGRWKMSVLNWNTFLEIFD